jgi:hypothetical protein
MKTLICLLIISFVTSVAVAGEIYGTIVDAGKPLPAGVRVSVTIADKSFTADTDKFGSYHVFATGKGKGTLTVDYKGQKLAAEVFSYDKPTRYDWTVEPVDGKPALKRK